MIKGKHDTHLLLQCPHCGLCVLLAALLAGYLLLP